MATISTWVPWQPGSGPVDRAWRWIRLLGIIYLAACAAYILHTSGWIGGALPEVRVPDAIGLSRETAFAKMQRLGLTPHVQDGPRSDGYAQGAVMQQSLTPGMHVRAGRGVYLLVCSGALHVIVPDLRGLDSGAAARVIARLGLEPSIAANVPSFDVPFDSVVEQAPAPGVRAEYGTPVALALSNGLPDYALDEVDPSLQGAVTAPGDPGLSDPTAPLPAIPGTVSLGGAPSSATLPASGAPVSTTVPADGYSASTTVSLGESPPAVTNPEPGASTPGSAGYRQPDYPKAHYPTRAGATAPNTGLARTPYRRPVNHPSGAAVVDSAPADSTPADSALAAP
ncbi:MAG TPA: PASTA domain-containing protein [Armatimonadota bacterium]|nr:PASTA domain-containing protein [Armatimonadota bacterium]